MNRIVDNYIHEMFYRIHKRVFILLITFSTVFYVISLLLNYYSRPEVFDSLLTQNYARFFTIFLMLAIYYFAKKRSTSNSFMSSLIVSMIVILFYQVFYLSFRVNNLLFSAVVFGLVYTIFIVDRKLVITLQIVGYLLIFIRIYDGDFSEYIFPQLLSGFGVIIMATFLFYHIRKVLYNLLFFLSEKKTELEKSNHELEMIKTELEIRVIERTKELEIANLELANVLRELKDSQAELLLSASLESYIELSKGISHQINTPLGVANTSISYIQDFISKYKQDLEDNTHNAVTFRTRLEETIDLIEETIELIEKSINRSIEVINILDNFKEHEKLEHTKLSELLRKFEVQIHAYDIHRVAKIKIDCNFECDLLIPFETFINILKSFIDNSVQNNNQENLTIKLTVVNYDTYIQIIISDDGKGIPPEFIDKVFNSYTSMSPHRLGMGMFIAYSFITLTMNGDLVVDKTYTEGARFVITIPKEINS